ncbi:MAG: hypothetical protein INQ03_12630 [Candidatus Heimdallarchaeota archaeon]|nr:hypothetical protein [Candidatus Heimdallarchaeota archaeon]
MVDIDLFSFVPAVFGSVLSLYNWLQTRKPANIHANPIVQYGLVSSSYAEEDLLTIPLVYTNEGAFKGTIVDIKIGLKSKGQTKYFEVLGKVTLNSMSSDDLQSMDMEAYSNNGYKLQMPTYPIDVYPEESTTVILLAVAAHEDKVLPLDVKSEWKIETYFDNKVSKDVYPFSLNTETYESAEYLKWLRS